MKNIVVCPDLYQGSSLNTITHQVIQATKAMDINIAIVPFIQDKIELLDGSLDDPEIFFAHNIHALKNLSEIMDDRSQVLFLDFFQPSLALLHYYVEGKKMNVKYGALFHGATFIPEDFFSTRLWMKPFEIGVIELLDRVYVPSKYAVQFFPAQARHKIRVFDYGFCVEDYERNLCPQNKCFDVVIPHRWSWDKGVEFYTELIRTMPEMRFIVSRLGITSKDIDLCGIYEEISGLKNVTVIGSTKSVTYLKALKQSKVVIAANRQELFGYGFREAVASGCIPVCINQACYPEFVPSAHLFDEISEAVKLIKKFVTSYPDFYIDLTSTSFEDILEDFYEN
jgi:hypothetical protein